MSNELHPKGLTVEVDTAGGTSYATVGNIVGVKVPSKSKGVGETTNFSSSNAYRTFLGGWKMGEDATLRLRFDKTIYGTLDTAFESDVTPNWRIKLPLLSGESTNSQWVFLAIITNLGPPEVTVDSDDVVEAELTLKVSGKPVYTAGAA